mgnify:FL=1
MFQFFNKEDEERIIAAIRAAEQNTSGEIRVHLEKDANGDVVKEARRTFAHLKMHKTKARNGVLIFLVLERKEFAIIGDKGINDVVGENFWQAERDIMQAHFRQGDFAGGICKAIEQVGEKLKAHFPYQSDDENELPDETSYSD